MIWHLSHRADPLARAIADRHYNRQKVGSPQFVPPGRCLVLRCEGAFWVTSWPFAEYVKHAWAGAWVCSAFRNERPDLHLSSDLIREAVAVTRWRWPDVPALGMVTFVDPDKTRHKRDPGRCYLRAGFRYTGHLVVHNDCALCVVRMGPCGTTKGGLPALRLAPADMPAPCAPIGAQTLLEVA